MDQLYTVPGEKGLFISLVDLIQMLNCEPGALRNAIVMYEGITGIRCKTNMKIKNQNRAFFRIDCLPELCDINKDRFRKCNIPLMLQHVEEMRKKYASSSQVVSPISDDSSIDDECVQLRMINAKLRENLTSCGTDLSELKKINRELEGKVEWYEKQLIQRQKAVEAGHAGLQAADDEIATLKESLVAARNDIQVLQLANAEYGEVIKEREKWLNSLSPSPLTLQTIIRNSIVALKTDHPGIDKVFSKIASFSSSRPR